ncbi:MAG: MATE family efflux transporter [Lachnospiraceae bacterium]|nr:MATE family efflux transporter [Lachnospiraceae bacterium]
MKNTPNFTEGKILMPLLGFMLPVLFAMFLQAMYGAVDLLVVGRFATSADVSGVSTGSQILLTLTNLLVSFAMGITVTIGQQIGEGKGADAGKTVGCGIYLFLLIGIAFTIIGVLGADFWARIMNAPTEAYDITVRYVRICSAGFLVIIAYNLLGSIFRGLGDSRTPLLAVGIACVCNIFGDLLFVAVFHMGAAGAALATVFAQFISVIVSVIVIVKNRPPFTLKRESVKFEKVSAGKIIRIGAPIALQDFLVGISFLVILAIVNELGVTASAGVGVAEKVAAFIMLVPAAFMQSMSSFVAQNIGAKKPERATLALRYGIMVSFLFGVAMFYLSFFHGNLLAAIFSKDSYAVTAAFQYLRSYAIDCLLTCFLFCFIGYYNGMGATTLVMAQGIIGAFLVRIPVAFFMSRYTGGSLFHIGLATPCSTIVQIIICSIAFFILRKKASHTAPYPHP